MSSSIGVNTGGPAQTLIANLKKTIDNGNTTKQALSAATQQIPTAWSGPAAQNWLTDAQSTITSLGSFLQETQAALQTATNYINNIATAGGGSGVN